MGVKLSDGLDQGQTPQHQRYHMSSLASPCGAVARRDARLDGSSGKKAAVSIELIRRGGRGGQQVTESDVLDLSDWASV